jgi:hypothetical protein
MAGYTKEFLIDAGLFKFEPLGKEAIDELRPLFEKCYDDFGKDKYRTYTSLDAAAIKEYKEFISNE